MNSYQKDTIIWALKKLPDISSRKAHLENKQQEFGNTCPVCNKTDLTRLKTHWNYCLKSFQENLELQKIQVTGASSHSPKQSKTFKSLEMPETPTAQKVRTQVAKELADKRDVQSLETYKKSETKIKDASSSKSSRCKDSVKSTRPSAKKTENKMYNHITDSAKYLKNEISKQKRVKHTVELEEKLEKMKLKREQIVDKANEVNELKEKIQSKLQTYTKLNWCWVNSGSYYEKHKVFWKI